MWRSLVLALALCLLPSGGTESQDQSSLCKQPPAWSIRDQDPMLNSNGSVTVVALLQASYLCILQASKLSKMKTFVNVYLWLLWIKQLKLHRLITIMSIITITDISTLAAVSFQRISNQEHQMLLLILLLQAFITTISTRVSIGRVTQKTEICQEVKIYKIYKRSSVERDV
uniref:Selenoprotein P N-terminal domain-containing protein n=1 Tax=Gorilla gorilla gorilla TaxID=9595 RepID=A0A2I2ZSK9_GORGO